MLCAAGRGKPRIGTENEGWIWEGETVVIFRGEREVTCWVLMQFKMKYLRVLQVIGLSGVQFGLKWSDWLTIEFGGLRSGSPICLTRVLLEIELDETKHFYQFIKTMTEFERKNIANPLIPASDQHLISLFSIKVMRIKEMIINWRASWLLNKFSLPGH